MAFITAVVEGLTDAAVVRRVVSVTNHQVSVIHNTRGKSRLDRHLLGYNNAARFSPWLVLRDLNSDAECAPELISRLLPLPSEGMMLRIAQREIEAWLLADRETLSAFLRVSEVSIPRFPEDLNDPKQTITFLGMSSKRRDIRDDFTPIQGASVGPGYTAQIIQFALNYWNPLVAAGHAPTLEKTISAIQEVA